MMTTTTTTTVTATKALLLAPARYPSLSYHDRELAWALGEWEASSSLQQQQDDDDETKSFPINWDEILDMVCFELQKHIVRQRGREGFLQNWLSYLVPVVNKRRDFLTLRGEANDYCLSKVKIVRKSRVTTDITGRWKGCSDAAYRMLFAHSQRRTRGATTTTTNKRPHVEVTVDEEEAVEEQPAAKRPRIVGEEEELDSIIPGDYVIVTVMVEGWEVGKHDALVIPGEGIELDETIIVPRPPTILLPEVKYFNSLPSAATAGGRAPSRWEPHRFGNPPELPFELQELAFLLEQDSSSFDHVQRNASEALQALIQSKSHLTSFRSNRTKKIRCLVGEGPRRKFFDAYREKLRTVVFGRSAESETKRPAASSSSNKKKTKSPKRAGGAKLPTLATAIAAAASQKKQAPLNATTIVRSPPDRASRTTATVKHANPNNNNAQEEGNAAEGENKKAAAAAQRYDDHNNTVLWNNNGGTTTSTILNVGTTLKPPVSYNNTMKNTTQNDDKLTHHGSRGKEDMASLQKAAQVLIDANRLVEQTLHPGPKTDARCDYGTTTTVSRVVAHQQNYQGGGVSSNHHHLASGNCKLTGPDDSDSADVVVYEGRTKSFPVDGQPGGSSDTYSTDSVRNARAVNVAKISKQDQSPETSRTGQHLKTSGFKETSDDGRQHAFSLRPDRSREAPGDPLARREGSGDNGDFENQSPEKPHTLEESPVARIVAAFQRSVAERARKEAEAAAAAANQDKDTGNEEPMGTSNATGETGTFTNWQKPHLKAAGRAVDEQGQLKVDEEAVVADPGNASDESPVAQVTLEQSDGPSQGQPPLSVVLNGRPSEFRMDDTRTHASDLTMQDPEDSPTNMQRPAKSYVSSIRSYQLFSSSMRREAYLLLQISQWKSWHLTCHSNGAVFAKTQENVINAFRDDELALFKQAYRQATSHIPQDDQALHEKSKNYCTLREKTFSWWCSLVQGCCSEFANQVPRVWNDFEYTQRSLWEYFNQLELAMRDYHFQEWHTGGPNSGTADTTSLLDQNVTIQASADAGLYVQRYVGSLNSYLNLSTTSRNKQFVQNYIAGWKTWIEGQGGERTSRVSFLEGEEMRLEKFRGDESALVDLNFRTPYLRSFDSAFGRPLFAREIELYLTLREKMWYLFCREILCESWKTFLADDDLCIEEFVKSQTTLWEYFARMERAILKVHGSRCSQLARAIWVPPSVPHATGVVNAGTPRASLVGSPSSAGASTTS